MSRASRSGLEAEILAWMADPAWGLHDEARFDELALRLFALQTELCPPYARFCQARGVSPGSIAGWREIPPVPTGAFKEVALRCFPAERTCKIFRTSGTTTDRRGELHLDTLALYEASLLPSLQRHLFPDLGPGERANIRVLAPSPASSPDSSLSHMFGCALEALGDADSGYDVQGGSLDVDGLRARLDRSGDRPVALFGTAFAFVHLLEALSAEDSTIELAPGSRIMETGGFKGRSRTMPREDLYASLGERLGVPERSIVNQYGMTELGSQFYDSVLLEPGEPRRKLGPPWSRVRLVDPSTGSDVPEGAVGMIVVHDLANTGSVAAIQTADLGRRIAAAGSPLGAGFEVLGRSEGAEARGCSIAADAMLVAAP